MELEQREGPSRTHALLETVRKLLEVQHEEEEISTAKGGLCEESTLAQESPSAAVVASLGDATPVAEEHIVAVPTNKKRSVQRQGIPGGPCANCGTKDSPQWRRPSTKKIVLCNACGIYFSRHNTLPQRSSNNSRSNKKGLSSSTDMGNESASGEDEAITAAGPQHHMALLQQAACAVAAANEGPYMRRPSSHSNTSQTDVINMSQSSHRSSPSRSSQEDEVMLDDLPAPPTAAVKQEDAAAAHSQSSTQQPIPIPAVPSRKRSLRTGSTSAPTTTPIRGATNPTFSAPNAPPPPQAPTFAAHSQPWGPQPSQLLHQQQQQQQQQQLLHMHLLGGAFPTPPSPYLMRVLASTQPHPQLLASQQSVPLPALHHMQQRQHALVLHHVRQMQQQQLHALGGLVHLSSVYKPHATGLLGQGSTGVARSSEAGPSVPIAQQSSTHSSSASRKDPIRASALPPASVQFQQQQHQQLHRLITTQPPAWPAVPLTEHGNAPPSLQQQQSQQQPRGAGAQSAAAQVSEGQAAVTCHLLSPSSQQLLLQQHPRQQQSEEENEDAADMQQRLLEPAAKRHQRQGSIGSGPEGASTSTAAHAFTTAALTLATAAHTMTTQGWQGGHALKMIPSYACRGPRAVPPSDATSSMAALQQQQRQQQQQQLLLQKQMVATAPPLASGGGKGSCTAVSMV